MKKAIIVLICLCSLAVAQDKPYRALNSFNAGQLSELLSAREDLSKYHSGCSVMENFFPLPQGGAQKRPGTVYVAESKNNTKIRLLPFEYSTEQSYISEFGNQYLRLFTDNAAITTGNGLEDLSSLDNIVAHWLLNDNLASTTVIDDGATHNGTATADTVVLSTTGKVGTGCFDMDEQYAIAVSDHVNFSFDDSGSNPFSVIVWAYVDGMNKMQIIASKWKEDTAREWRLSVNSFQQLQMHLSDDSVDQSGNRVAQWYLNDDAASTHVDDVSTNHDGVASSNTDTFNATGKINGCLDFGDTEYVTVSDNVALSFGDGTDDSAFSISFWMYVIDSSTQSVMSKYDAGVAVEWFLYLDPGEKLNFLLYDDSAGAYISAYTTSALTVGWHHIVVTYDGSEANTGITIYSDGDSKALSRGSVGTYVAMENTATNVLIGSRYVAGNEEDSFEDKLDNVILFNAEISATTILNLYNSGYGTESLAVTFPSCTADDSLDVGWHFIAMTYDSTGGATAANGIILYVDGAAVDFTANNESDYVAMENTATDVKIGCQESAAASNEKFWGDKLDAISIFSDVLTPTEIANLYSTSSYEVTTCYLTADLFELKYEQSADVLYINHPDYEPRKLSRLANSTWTLEVLGIENGPFRDQNTTITGTIAASATTGTVILTATGCTPFISGTTAGHEPSGSTTTSKSQTGALFRLVHPLTTLEYSETLTDNYTNSQVENTSWMNCGIVYRGASWNLTTLGTWTGALEIQRNYTIGAAHDASGWEKVFAYASTDDRNVSTNGTEDEAAASYRGILTESGDAAEPCKVYFRTNQTEHDGIVKITAVASPTSATATVLTTLGSTNATHKWSEGAWSNYRGWPRIVIFFEDRLVFGGNASQPDTIWASVTADYENMLEGADDDDALLFTLSSRKVNVIEWMIGKDKILIGSSGAEWTLGGSADEPLTPSNVKAEQHLTHGSANLQAVLAGESVLFFQRGAEKMRELAYNWESDSYTAPDMTILVPEVTGDGITEMAFQQTPNPILWCVKENGDIATFIYERNEQITSWSTQITDGDFESVAIISGSAEDQVWVSVERDIDSSTVRYIEYFSVRDYGSDDDDAFYVDSGITYDSTATTTITGLTHLNTETVSVLGDGVPQTSQAVSGNQITITSASTVQVGLPFTAQLRTMPLSWVAEGMTIQGRIKRINEVIARYYNSGDFYVGRDATTKEALVISGMDTDEERITFPAGYDRPGYVFIYQQSPEPLTLLALMVEFQIY